MRGWLQVVAAVRSWWKTHPVSSWGLVGVITAALVVSAFVLSAQGATTAAVYPSGVTPGVWVLTGSAATALDTNDGDTSRIRAATSGNAFVQLDSFAPIAVPGTTIDSVTVYVHGATTGNDDINVTLAFSGVSGGTTTALDVPTVSEPTSPFAGSPLSATFATAPDGSVWGSDWARLENLEVVLARQQRNSADNVRATQVYAVVNYTPDTIAPTVNATSPTNGATLGTPAYTIQGTASDAETGVSSVDVQIARFNGATPAGYWTGTDWSGTSGTWLDATGTTSWSYVWNLDPDQNGTYTYTIASRAYDAASNLGTDPTPVTGISVSNIGPSLVSASVVDATHVDVVFDESIDPASVNVSDFAVDNGVTVGGFSVDGATVHLTTSVLIPGTTYTVSLPGVVTDTSGNADRNNTTTFSLVPLLDVSPGIDYPASRLNVTRGAVEAVDQLFLTASVADATVSSITIRGRDTANSLDTDVTSVRLFVDTGTIGAWEPGVDTTQIGSAQSFSGPSGDGSSVATFSGLSYTVPVGSVRVWVVYAIGPSAGYDHIVGSEVRTGDVVLSTGVVTITGSPILSSGTSAGQTLYVDGPPAVAITAPAADGDSLNGTTATLSGTASDGGGSGVSSVELSILRSDGKYWDGTWASSAEVWNAATTSNGWADWSYDWALDAGQNHSFTYTVTARATDGSSLQSSAVRSGIVVDNVAPSIVQATPVDATTIDVDFSEELSAASVQAGDFSITGVPDGLTVLSASMLDSDTVRVTTTTSQVPTQSYTITCAAGRVQDLYLNFNSMTFDDFVGFGLLDSEDPAVVIAAPSADGNVSASPYTVSGTASDTGGSGLANVAVRITRSDGQYWNGSGWSAVNAWLTATGTDSWSYSWSQTSDDRTYTHIIEARATDGADNTAVSSVTGVRVDTVGPAIISSTATDATHLTVYLSEEIDPTTIGAGDFTIAGLSVSGVTAVGPDYTEIVLTTSAQVPDTTYVVETTAGRFTDSLPFGVPNVESSDSFLAFGSASDPVPPTAPTTVNAVAGADPVVATVTWSGATDNIGVDRYRIYRATSLAGTYSVIGLVNEPTATFDDQTGIPGQAYYYKVSALDAAGNESPLSAAAGPVSALWTRAPHAAYDDTTSFCSMCHLPHVAASTRGLLRDAGESPPETGVCYACHDASGASSNIKTGAVNSFALTSGHTLEAAATDPDLTNSCAGCHSPHRDYATTPRLPGNTVNGVVLGDEPNAWCLACHNSDNDWYGAGYPNPASPTLDPSGYPTVGTFGTESAPAYVAYNDATRNAHFSIEALPALDPPRAQGDCLYCHASHRGPSDFDGLVAAFRPSTAGTLADDQANGTYAEVCFKCHGSNEYGLATPPTNIKQFVTEGTARSGHRIKTAGGTYEVGSPLPCYECHNPHGTTRDNGHLFSDVLGESLDTTTVAGGEHLVREFCFTCHTAAGDDGATPDDVAYAWDSSSAAYVVVSAGSEVAGLARDAAIGANVVRLPAVNGHFRDDPQSCYGCHGSSYAAGGNNVHNPSGGISDGGVACYNCHGQYQQLMEDGAGAKVGSQRASVYHHVLGGASGEGDFAPPVSGDLTGYPTGFGGGMYCLSCHVDHDKFNASPGANLRRNAVSTTDGAPYGTNTDFDLASPFAGGLCTSCHAIAVGRDTVDQKAAGTVVQSVDFGTYSSSAHQYKVSSEFGSGNTFLADCSKCHNDEQPKEFQTSANAFGTHWSAERSILSAFGAAVTDPMGEQHCYGCHAGGTAGPDGYGTQPDYGSGAQDMTALSRSIEDQFGLTSKHPVVPTGSGAGNINSVECANCHNPHEVSSANPVSDPDNTYTAHAYTTPTQQADFCLTCHSAAASLPTLTVTGATLRPSTVTIALADQPAMNKSANADRGHWSAAGSISVAEQVACGSCHDNHGSNAPKLLGEYDPSDGLNKIGSTTISANNNSVCYACHTAASTSYPAVTRNATTGYPEDGTWPGTGVYTQAWVADTSGNGHVMAQGVAALNTLPTTYAAGDCKVCHDVHGTANEYDETRLAFDPTDFTLCFDCHDLNGPASSNIKNFYPVSVGGTGAGSGHQIKTATGTLPLDSGLPCYDCHNPHGNSNAAYGLTVITETAPGVQLVLGDAANEIRMSAADKATGTNVRAFCFACHTTSDTSKGWDGDSLETVTAGAEVEGIDRTVSDAANGLVLRLPDDVAAHREGNSQSCYQCHGNDYSLSGQNVHNPSGGISAGGQDCYTCHGTYQTNMEDDQGAKTGSDNGLSYHHVLGASTGAADGDRAFAAGSYPASTTDVYCLSCHVDHNLFNSPNDLAANLRADLGASPASGVAYDWSDAANAGVCTSCHGTNSLPKAGAAEKLADGRAQTPTVGNADYDASAHKYAVPSTFASDATPAFSASCSKCHTDEQARDFQNSSFTFGVHWSANQHILSALGGANGGALQQSHCYRCHAETSDFVANGGALVGTAKPVAGRDWYDAADMTSAGTEKVYKQFNLTSKHPVTAAGGDSVECESCHNVHEVSAGSKVSDPENTYTVFAYTDVTNQPAYCLKCHDGTLPSQTITAATYVPYTVTQANTAVNNKSDAAKVSKGHWTTSGSIAAGERVSCAQCHDNHGSNAPKLLGAYDPGTGTNKIGTTVIAANNNTVCYACHSAQTAAAYTREANGYTSYGTWPGQATYSSGIHNGAAVRWPGRTDATGGECWNCHDVHGTNSTYDELVGQFNPSSGANDAYALCFNCHDADGPAAVTRNIKQYYPATSGGTSSATNAGHQIKTAGGTLTVGTGLPCYDCHNPHGSAEPNGLLVETMIAGTMYRMGDSAAEIGDMTNAASCRLFCFLCHTTATGRGTNSAGTGYTAIAATDLVEGISRNPAVDNNALKLSSIAAHTEADGRSCLTCHGGMTATNSVNVHAPSSGAGGGPCLGSGCHGSDSTERLDKMISDATTYHHVLEATGADANTYDTTPNSNEVRCLSCHVDHANFNTSAGNLRSAYNDSPTGSFGLNSDFPGNGTYGVCISCHSVAQPKSGQGTTQKAGGSTTTPAISGAVYDTSAHDYKISDAAKVGYGTDAFLANCVKCHDDGAAAPSARQTGTIPLAPHYSAENRIAQALGAVLAGTSTQTEQNLCYTCHITATGSGTDRKVTTGRDGYDIVPNYGAPAVMSSASEAIYGLFQKAFRHNVAGYSGVHKSDELTAGSTQFSATKHVECEDCHEPHNAAKGVHAAGTNAVSGAIRGASGMDWTAGSTNWSTAGSTLVAVGDVTYEYEICLKCHSRANPNLTTWNAGWTDVALEFNTANESYHPVFGPIRTGRALTADKMRAPWTTNLTTLTMYCSDCHGDDAATSAASGPHGSAYAHALKGTWTGAETLGGVRGSTTFLCNRCHTLLDGTSISTAHSKGQHQVFACSDCHILRPHGGKVPRLLSTNETPAPYGSGSQLDSFEFPISRTQDCDTVCGNHSDPGTYTYQW